MTLSSACVTCSVAAVVSTLRPAKAPLSVGFSGQQYWSGLPCPPSGDLPDPGIEPVSLMSPALAGGFSTTSTTWDALDKPRQCIKKQRHHP